MLVNSLLRVSRHPLPMATNSPTRPTEPGRSASRPNNHGCQQLTMEEKQKRDLSCPVTAPVVNTIGAGDSTLNIVKNFVDPDIDLSMTKEVDYSNAVEALLKATHDYTAVMVDFVKCYLSSSKVKADSRFCRF